MTHRTVKVDGTLINVFDSQGGADRFIRDNPVADIAVAVRGRWLMMRRNGFEMIINNAGVVSNAREAGVQSSGQALLDEIEAMIKLEIDGEADKPAGASDFPTISFKAATG